MINKVKDVYNIIISIFKNGEFTLNYIKYSIIIVYNTIVQKKRDNS